MLSDCSRAVHMFDYEAWDRFTTKYGASEHVWDQCMKASNPTASPVKGTVWLCTPNIAGIVDGEFGTPPQSLCNHPDGTHKALRGTVSSGRYVTSSLQMCTVR